MSILAVEIPREVVGYFQMAAGELTTATSVKIGGGSVLLLQAEGQNVRIRLDGVDPTATVGHLLLANSSLVVNLGPKKGLDIKAIEAAVGGILNITAFR